MINCTSKSVFDSLLASNKHSKKQMAQDTSCLNNKIALDNKQRYCHELFSVKLAYNK